MLDMKTVSPTLTFLLRLARVQAVLARRFDSSLGGIGMSDFLILYHLTQASDHKMRRIDLAEKIGLTASGVTRLLAPMEKIGLIKRAVNTHDARVSYVMLAPGGARMFQEALENAELFCEETFPPEKNKTLGPLSEVLYDIGELI